MNIINSRTLLLSFLLSVSMSIQASVGFNDSATIEDSKKELIIVNVDESLSASLEQLASYVYQLYGSDDSGNVSIKRYIKENDAESKESVKSLVTLLIQKGISENNIQIADEPLQLENPYFTLAVSDGPDIQ